MYNRYIRNDHGDYTRIPQEDAPQTGGRNSGPSGGGHAVSGTRSAGDSRPPGGDRASGGTPYENRSQEDAPPRWEKHSPPREEAGQRSDGLTGILQHFLDQLHLDHVDTGDLLLLGLLFFLFREDADEELLVALGLLLIL